MNHASVLQPSPGQRRFTDSSSGWTCTDSQSHASRYFTSQGNDPADSPRSAAGCRLINSCKVAPCASSLATTLWCEPWSLISHASPYGSAVGNGLPSTSARLRPPQTIGFRYGRNRRGLFTAHLLSSLTLYLTPQAAPRPFSRERRLPRASSTKQLHPIISAGSATTASRDRRSNCFSHESITGRKARSAR